jgi:hypothetical protein
METDVGFTAAGKIARGVIRSAQWTRTGPGCARGLRIAAEVHGRTV